jgi:hypothetical protein
MRKIIQILLFIISYAPLYIILSIQNIDSKYLADDGVFIGFKQVYSDNKITLILLGITFFSIIAYYILYKIVLRSAPIKKS